MKKTVFRIDDIVRIEHPEVVERIGYPLTLKSQIEELKKDPKVDSLIQQLLAIAAEGKPISKTDSDSLLGLDWAAEQLRFKRESSQYRGILYQLACSRLAAKSYGGNQKQLYTKYDEQLLGQKALVINKRVVYTGEYVPASGISSRSYFCDDCDFEPAYLANSKAHVILTLKLLRKNDLNRANYYCYSDLNIVDRNVGKIVKIGKFAFEQGV